MDAKKEKHIMRLAQIHYPFHTNVSSVEGECIMRFCSPPSS